jgi:putative transposase
VRDRIELVDKQHTKISMRKQSKLLGVARSTITYRPVEEDPEDIRIKRLLDEIYMKDPCLGSQPPFPLVRASLQCILCAR